MTGRDLIIYILEHHLEDEELFKDGKIPGLMTYEEAAVKFNVGTCTIRTWVTQGFLKGINFRGIPFIPETAELNIKGGNS